MRSVVLGTGHYVPPRVVTNQDLAGYLDTSDDWIRKRTGIVERRYVEDGVGPSDLAYEAALGALEMAGMEAHEIDCIVFATLSSDYSFPGSGVLLQRRLGITDTGIPAFDIRNQCSGYLYGLQVVDALIRQGVYSRVLLAGAEVHSSGLEHTPRGRDVTVLFGDGAGVTIFGPTHDPERGLLSIHLHSNGMHAEKLMLECPSARVQPCRITEEMIQDGRAFPTMDGRYVFRHAVTFMPKVVKEALEHNALAVEAVDHWFFHQANLRINEMVAAHLGIDPERSYHNIDRYGNLSAGAIPALLDATNRAGKLRPGDLCCMAGFGSGFTWGSALLRW